MGRFVQPSSPCFSVADVQVRLWNPTTGEAVGAPLLGHSKWITSLSFEPVHLLGAKALSPRLASASKDGTVRIWNTSTRKLEFVLTGHAASVNVVRWGGEGVIYTGSSDRTVRVWSGVDVGTQYALGIEVDWTDASSGQAHPHTVGTRPLGEHNGPQYRLHPSYRSI